MSVALDRPIRFVVIGDSAAYGIGDVMKAHRPLGWTYRIAEAVQHPLIYLNLARPGAKSTELVEHQLPIARSMKPDYAVVVVGGNDLLRNNFCPERLHNNLVEIFSNLIGSGTQIITLELHDPTKLLKLPDPLKRALLKRVDAVNQVYQDLAQKFPLISIKARQIEGVNNRENWHVDLLHPGPKGHFLLAKTALLELENRGLPVKRLETEDLPQLSRAQKISWMLKKGTPWFIKRCFDLLPVAVFLIIKELLLNLFAKKRSVSTH